MGAYYRGYRRLVDHRRAVLPIPMLDGGYEELVENPQATIRFLVDFCALPWEEACLTPHETARRVTTASRWQVRQPIYKTSLQRHRNYEAYLGPLERALEG